MATKKKTSSSRSKSSVRSSSSGKKKSAKGTGLRKAADIGGKSYSQIAREVLKKTGDRSKASAKLREVGCASASAVVAKVAQRMNIPSQKKSKAKVTVKKKGTKTKATGKKKRPAPRQDEPDDEEDFEEDEFEEDDF